MFATDHGRQERRGENMSRDKEREELLLRLLRMSLCDLDLARYATKQSIPPVVEAGVRLLLTSNNSTDHRLAMRRTKDENAREDAARKLLVDDKASIVDLEWMVIHCSEAAIEVSRDFMADRNCRCHAHVLRHQSHHWRRYRERVFDGHDCAPGFVEVIVGSYRYPDEDQCEAWERFLRGRRCSQANGVEYYPSDEKRYLYRIIRDTRIDSIRDAALSRLSWLKEHYR